jgi:hypothetical protein
MTVQLIVLLGALIVAYLVFNWAIKVVKVSIGTGIAIAAIILILQLSFGIGPEQLWQQMINLPQTLLHLIKAK